MSQIILPEDIYRNISFMLFYVFNEDRKTAFCLIPMKLGSKHVEIKILANSQNRTRMQMNIISIKEVRSNRKIRSSAHLNI